MQGTFSLQGAICEHTDDLSFPLSCGLGDCVGLKKVAMPPTGNDGYCN